jgi:4-oxalocrotonate tautomerase
MPVVEVKMLAGRNKEQKTRLVQEITRAMVETLGVTADGVHVILQDVPREDWARGGVLFSDRQKD